MPSERTLNKMNSFFSDLQGVDYTCSSSTVEFDDFKNQMCDSSDKLKNLCVNTLKTTKGSTTRKYLEMIKKSAENLKEALNKNFVVKEIFQNIDSVCTAFGDLASKVKAASKAYYPSLINKSTLDYPATRKLFSEISDNLKNCAETLCALANENNCKKLINYLNDINDIALRGSEELPEILYFFIIVNRKTFHVGFIYVDTVPSAIDFKLITTYLQKLRHIRNFSAIIKSFDNIKRKFGEIKKKGETTIETTTCALCQKQKKCVCCGDQNGCEHKFCLDCLIYISAKRFTAFKCPICKKTLNKDYVLYYIAMK